MALLVFERYWVAHDALMALTLIPSLVLFFCTLCMARRRKDPARTGFTYLKAAFAFFTAFVFFDMCGYALSLAYTRTLDNQSFSISGDDDANVLKVLINAEVDCYAVAGLFDSITDILVLFTLLRLATGIIIAKTGEPDMVGKITKFASYGIAVLLLVLDIAQFALKINFYNKYYSNKNFFRGISPSQHLVDDFAKARQIDFSFHVLVFVLALAVVGRSIMVKMQTRTEPRVATATNLLIPCAVLWLLRTTYNMASYVEIVNLSNPNKDPVARNYFIILDVAFGVWPQFTLLTIAFCLGAKKRNGLWSTEQPFMMVNPDAPATAWGYGAPVNVPPMQQQQQGWQPQQQPPVPQAYYPPPQQQQQQQQQQFIPQQHGYPPQQQIYSQPTAQTWSPPPHEDTIGLNHQADGTPPQANQQPYVEKH